MADVRVGEAFHDRFRVGAAFGFGQGYKGHDFREHHLLEIAGNHRVFGHLLHGVQTGAVGGQRAGSMRAVQNAYFSRAVGLQIIGPDDIQSGLMQRQAGREMLRPFDHPQQEGFGSDQQRVTIAEFSV